MLVIYYLISILSLSQSANIIRFAHASALTVGFWRLSGATLILTPFCLSRRAREELLNLSGRAAGLLMLSAFFFFLHLWSYFFSAQHTSVANCVIIFAVNPVFTALGAYVFHREQVTWRMSVAYILAFLALWILFLHSVRMGSGQLPGDLGALMAALAYSGYVLSGKAVRQQLGNMFFVFVVDGVAGIFFLIAGLGSHQAFASYTLTTWFAILALLIFPTLLGHAMFSYCLRYMNINLMSCGKLFEPMLATLVAFLIFHEPLVSSAAWAFVLAAMSVLLLFLPSTPLLSRVDKRMHVK